NQHRLSPTGYQDSGDTERFVRVHSEFATARECNDLVVQTRAGAPIWKTIRIGDVGRCEEGTDEIRRVSRFNGIEPTVGLGVIKQRGTNAVEIGDAIHKRIQELAQVL